ncbi:MAG: response regulator transcription factor [Lachnospiraceae bacterium]|nr:response regulator transcription factor [Lachnospiraceae bacterium]
MIELYYMEDDPDIASAVKEYLEQKDFRVSIYAGFAQARQALQAHIPGLVLLDWNMPDGRGDRLCQWIRGCFKELPIIFLTVRGDCADIVSGFQSGADDYIVKPFELEILHSRILALLRRTRAGQYLTCDGIVIDQNRQTVSLRSREIALSLSEYQLLLYLMQNKGRTVTREKILEQVWDLNGNYVNDNTLTVTMKRLRDKLSQPACIKTVRSVGYRMEDTL